MPHLLSRRHKLSFVNFIQSTRVLRNVTAFDLHIIPMTVSAELLSDCIVI